jgi:hypothetical protein
LAIRVSMIAEAPIASRRSMIEWTSPRRTIARTAHPLDAILRPDTRVAATLRAGRVLHGRLAGG